ncbi:hypothetical protein [Streptomyces prunicolor]|uniref:hypothetical protein n=1 Tax=Streptomyces prunicolor TaxID=67348 RepID=UPI0033C2AE57
MANLATGLTQCPECHEPLLVPVRARQVGPAEYALHFDLSQVREHVDTHVAGLATELPPAAQ